MDVAHVPSFGKLQYVHVFVNTFSRLIFASAYSGGRGERCIKPLLPRFCIYGNTQAAQNR